MRLLIDNNVSIRVVAILASMEIEASHITDHLPANALDEQILQLAVSLGSVIVTADSDFPEMLALSGMSEPSTIYLTGSYPTDPSRLAVLLANALPMIADDLEKGAVVAIDGARIRIRSLPIG